MELKVRRVGSSLGVILPKSKLDEAGIHEGDVVLLPRFAPRMRRELYGVWKRRPVRLEFEGP